MSERSHTRMTRERTRAFYLELRALGVELWAVEDEDDSIGYKVGARYAAAGGLPDSVAERIRAHKPGLLRILIASRWDVDLRAIRREGNRA